MVPCFNSFLYLLFSQIFTSTSIILRDMADLECEACIPNGIGPEPPGPDPPPKPKQTRKFTYNYQLIVQCKLPDFKSLQQQVIRQMYNSITRTIRQILCIIKINVPMVLLQLKNSPDLHQVRLTYGKFSITKKLKNLPL